MSKTGWACLMVVAVVLAASGLAPWLSATDPNAIDLDQLRLSPGVDHPFGTDQKGRDVFVRVLHGTRVSLGLAIAAATVSMALGLMVGLVSGYVGGRVDTAVMSAVDLVLSFPSLLLAIGISVVLPPGSWTVLFAMASVGWAGFARLTRGHVLVLREAPFLEAARAIGCGHWRVLMVHLLPQCIPLALVMMGLKLGGFIITEASLSFLGLGAQPPAPSWGAMVSASRGYMLTAPWMMAFPGMAIAVTALCCNMLGDALSERFGFKRELAK